MQRFLVRNDNRTFIFVKGLGVSCDGTIFVDDQIWRFTHDHPEFLSDTDLTLPNFGIRLIGFFDGPKWSVRASKLLLKCAEAMLDHLGRGNWSWNNWLWNNLFQNNSFTVKIESVGKTEITYSKIDYLMWNPTSWRPVIDGRMFHSLSKIENCVSKSLVSKKWFMSVVIILLPVTTVIFSSIFNFRIQLFRQPFCRIHGSYITRISDLLDD